MNKSDSYSDIINLSRPVSRRHIPMTMHDRAAQFAPFAALTGFEDATDETARLTDRRVERTFEEERTLNAQLRLIHQAIPSRPRVKLLCFVPDRYKQGGSYRTLEGEVRAVDDTGRTMIFTDGRRIPLDNIYSIDLLI